MGSCPDSTELAQDLREASSRLRSQENSVTQALWAGGFLGSTVRINTREEEGKQDQSEEEVEL